MKACLGAFVWLTVTVLGWCIAKNLPTEPRHALDRAQTELWRSLFEADPEVRVRFPGGVYLSHGDGVYVVKDGDLRRIGEVADTVADGHDLVATLHIDNARSGLDLTRDCRVVRRSQGQSFVFCLQTLITEPRQDEIEQVWGEFIDAHQYRLKNQLREILPALLEEIAGFLVEELGRSLDRHSPKVERLLQRYRRTITEEHALPLLIDEVWPIVRDELAEPSQIIGRELWDRAPLFDLAWRAAWDRVASDGPEKLEARWADFLEEDATPVLRAREPLIRRTLEHVLRRVVASEAVQEQVQAIAASMVEDPAVRNLAERMLSELMVDNPRLLEFLESRRDDPELRRRLEVVNRELQYFLDDLGNLLVFADPHDQEVINPDLAKLLRILLLRRDRRYLFLELHPGPPLAEGDELRGRIES